MKRKTIYIHLLFLATLFCFSCDHSNMDNSDEVLSVSNIIITDLGQVNPVKDFKMKKSGSSVTCEVRTKLIKKGDEIQKIYLYQQNKTLKINIISTPNDFDCIDLSCFTTHIVTFDIDKELPKGVYDIELGINNGYTEGYAFKYELN